MSVFDELKTQIETIKEDVKRSVEITLLRETIRWNVSRLMTLDKDPARQADYTAIMNSIGSV